MPCRFMGWGRTWWSPAFLMQASGLFLDRGGGFSGFTLHCIGAIIVRRVLSMLRSQAGFAGAQV